jgi:hypothetical protein
LPLARSQAAIAESDIGFVCCVRGDKTFVAGSISLTAFAGRCTTQAGAFVGKYHAPVLDVMSHEPLGKFSARKQRLQSFDSNLEDYTCFIEKR